mmetsp:Transcript_44799/g.106345  ORF Transcript_44799/g.106345 Transcript_44799/m.106345 type:complete len:436 (+) Transcript_44799:90-1397(+)
MSLLLSQFWISFGLCLSLANSEILTDLPPGAKVVVAEELLSLSSQQSSLVGDDDASSASGKAAHLLSLLEAKASKKAGGGLIPSEIAEAEQVKAVLVNNILPSLLAEVSSKQQEMDNLFESMLTCAVSATPEIHKLSALEGQLPQLEQNLTECVSQESSTLLEKERVCQDFTVYKQALTLPARPPAKDAPSADVHEFLQVMDDYFCGIGRVYEGKYLACKEQKTKLSETSEKCLNLQIDYERSTCSAKIHRMETCGSYSQCFRDTSKKYAERQAVAEEKVKAWAAEYEATQKALCLWDAWQLSCSPCTVDAARVQQCWNLQPNMSVVELSLQTVPAALECNFESPSTGGGEDYPCTPAFVQTHYASLMIEDGVLMRMKDACSACFSNDAPFTLPPAASQAAEEPAAVEQPFFVQAEERSFVQAENEAWEPSFLGW